MPKGMGYPKGHKGTINTTDVGAMGGVHGRGTQSFAKGKPPAGAKQSRPTGQTEVNAPMRRAH